MGDALNSRRESSLHCALKRWCSVDGDKLESPIGDFVVDIVRGDLLIEIQTANFSAIKPKLSHLLANHKVRLVYPIPIKKWIIHESTARTFRRRSPKRGHLCDLFREFVRIPNLFSTGNLVIEVLMIEEEEIWCDDGKGSWRRKGASIKDRKLIQVIESRIFERKSDFLNLLPEDLLDPFSNRSLAKNLGINRAQSQKMTYSLRKIGVITLAGKNGNQMLFSRC